MKWKGVILAGGTGSRLFPLTHVINKHLLPVYDKPMIYYPLTTLMLAGIRNIVIVSGRESLAQFETLLGDGAQWGISITYKAQERPAGIVDGLRAAGDELSGFHVALMLGDNIVYGSGLPGTLLYALEKHSGATVFSVEVADPSAFGIVELDAVGKPVDLVEKPTAPTSRLAVVGLYLYGPDVLEVAAKIKASARGELEITDLNRAYLAEGRLSVRSLGRGIAWLDGGTTGNLFAASLFVQVMEQRTGLKIACPEEIAWRYGIIDRGHLQRLVEVMPHSDYRNYLVKLLEVSPFHRDDDA